MGDAKESGKTTLLHAIALQWEVAVRHCSNFFCGALATSVIVM
jgi:hypothetical protein